MKDYFMEGSTGVRKCKQAEYGCFLNMQHHQTKQNR